VSDEPLVPGPLYGLRTWRVVGEQLAAPHRGVPWPAGGAWMEAECLRIPDHAAPVPGCDCGVHAWHPRRSSARRVLGVRQEVAGIIEAGGAVELHQDGFRAERGRPHALVVTPGRNAKLISRLAEAYRVPVVAVKGPDELLAWCEDRGLGLDAPVVARLLGPQPAVERRRRVRRDVLRLAAALVLAALLLILGSQFIPEPSPDKDVFGRTGKVVRNP
jgi:hypothetical protein